MLSSSAAASVVIVSPALADANNGNWQTARRWRELLRDRHAVRISAEWPDSRAAGDHVMLALHARRSAPAIAAWAQVRGSKGLAVVLTGTDLYQDIHTDRQAGRSLELAQRLVLLQELGAQALPEGLRHKAQVIFQSTSSRPPLRKTRRWLRAVMVGHLRQVKSPQTLFEAARLLAGRSDIRIDHVGAAQEPALGEQALAVQRDCPGYRWLGPLAHGRVRQLIQRAHVLVHTSAMEGGAHVIMEAVRSGTPVLASRIDGNVGMLGSRYSGYFAHQDPGGLAALLLECRAGQQSTGDGPPGLLAKLLAQADRRAHLFTPESERAALLRLVDQLQQGPCSA
jgi:putative glycosyltransferase (TIGR04348 family)